MKKNIGLFLFTILFHICSFGQNTATIELTFQNPPNEAQPRVWWHWMNGNITIDGIQKDLDWMEKTGIGGFHNFDANLFTPVVVDEKLVFMTPEWQKAFKSATDLAIEKGFELTIAGSPGWSVTGGPWVPAADGMKKYVWTETRIKGGQKISEKLRQPSETTGNFQNVALQHENMLSESSGDKPEYYNDALVIAYRLLPEDKLLEELNPKVSSSGGEFSLKMLTDGDLNSTSFLPPKNIGEDMWIQYEFDVPVSFKAVSVVGASQIPLQQFRGGPKNRTLEVSEDGINFREIASFSTSINPQNTLSFEQMSAKFWRLAIETLPQMPNPLFASSGMLQDSDPDGVNVAEFNLFTTDRIDQFEDKAGFSPWKEDTPSTVAGNTLTIETDGVVDITEFMDSQGVLNWEVPEGDWKVLRFGYSLTGRQNHPASPEATGLEVDKMDPEAVRRYINHYLDLYQEATGGQMGKEGLQYIILDSYEAGHMNWTHHFSDEFQKRNGYSIIPWMPVLTGRVVKNLEASEAFLWDFRNTIGEMIVQNHYDVIGEELNKRGMKRYTESHENGRIFLADGMDVKRNAEIPMSAMWTPGSLSGGADEEVRSEADIRESASVANIYGKSFVAAESMTSVGKPFQEHPEQLKRTADLELASGLNRFVIHTSVHQPLDDKKPGFSLGPFGQYFTRHETWSDMARPWVDYLSRSSLMLQQGRNIADILYLYGENSNITWIAREKLPEIPSGYEFDFVNSTALIDAIQPENEKLKAKSGNSYELLMIDESAGQMTLPVLIKLKSLAEAGVKIIGERPKRSPSLADSNEEFQDLADQIWALTNVGTEVKIEIDQDVIINGTDHKVLFRHRKTESEDIFWLNNRSVEPTSAKVSFRITGKKPMLWNPINAEVKEVSYEIKDGRTEIPLDFESWDAFFIVFRENATSYTYRIPEKTESTVTEIKGDWQVDFGSTKTNFASLKSWAEHANPEIKYFSGMASYTNYFDLTQIDPQERYEIDLGTVKNLAEVIVNGQNLGIVWKTPFRLDITKAMKPGENLVEIGVVNLWVNSLIGDAQPEAEKTTFTTMPFYNENSPLLPSGLLGPVTIIKID